MRKMHVVLRMAFILALCTLSVLSDANGAQDNVPTPLLDGILNTPDTQSDDDELVPGPSVRPPEASSGDRPDLPDDGDDTDDTDDNYSGDYVNKISEEHSFSTEGRRNDFNDRQPENHADDDAWAPTFKPKGPRTIEKKHSQSGSDQIIIVILAFEVLLLLFINAATILYCLKLKKLKYRLLNFSPDQIQITVKKPTAPPSSTTSSVKPKPRQKPKHVKRKGAGFDFYDDSQPESEKSDDVDYVIPEFPNGLSIRRPYPVQPAYDEQSDSYDEITL